MKRVRMLTAMSALALMLSVPAFAAEPAPAPAAPPAAPMKDKQAEFEKRKTTALERIDRRISSLQELRGCVAAASSREDMEKCREKFREEGEKEKEKAGRRRVK